LARQIYREKHEHEPEEFVPGEPEWRMDGIGVELDADEEALRKEYPTALFPGSPRDYLIKLFEAKQARDNS
jgi:hypothetical protein